MQHSKYIICGPHGIREDLYVFPLSCPWELYVAMATSVPLQAKVCARITC